MELECEGNIMYEGTKAYRTANSKEKELTIKDGTTIIGSHAFAICSNLETINIPSSVREIGFASFSNCFNLKNINLHEGLRYIDDLAFYYCKNLEVIRIPSTIVGISDTAFTRCEKLSKIYLPKKVWNLPEIKNFYERNKNKIEEIKTLDDLLDETNSFRKVNKMIKNNGEIIH